ncbi:MAG TPA: tyrosine-type recombinase/integrase [Sideroxyarcus sp.]|nr:tyrosine-type recombinase/integrase [Sideroxyarcus sp.]
MKQTPEPVGVFRRFLTKSEQPQFLGTIRQYSGEIAKRDHAVCQLMIGGGTRVGETLKASVGDAVAALESSYLFIPKEHRKGEACDLSVLVTLSIRTALLDLLSLREGAEMDEPLIVSRNSKGRGWKPMTVRAFEMRVAHWAKLAGLPDGVSPHWFRHTHAKNIVRSSEAKDPLRVAQLSLGQKSRRSTEVYTQLDREELEEALKQTDSALHAKPRMRMAQLRREYEGRVGACA